MSVDRCVQDSEVDCSQFLTSATICVQDMNDVVRPRSTQTN